jgi:hypothetical protein
MKLPVYVEFRGMEHSDAIATVAQAYAHKLESAVPNTIACHIGIDLERPPKQQEHLYGVRIDLTIPGHELMVSRVQREDVEVAMRDAFSTMHSQLEALARESRASRPMPLQ